MSTIRYFAYVVTFTGVSTDTFTNTIDKYPRTFANWYRPPLPQTVFIVSPYPAKFIGGRLRKIMKIENLLIVDADVDRSGWLPKKAWTFLQNPQPASEED